MATYEANAETLIQVTQLVVEAIRNNRKILFFGNGGSAADSQHVAAEFVGRFQKERPAFGAIALTTDTSILTALANDYAYQIVFARQIEALGQSGDIAVGFSTSGNSANVVEGIKKAKQLGLKTVCFTGCGGGALASLCDFLLDVPSKSTARIQESHMCMYHTICHLAEEELSE